VGSETIRQHRTELATILSLHQEKLVKTPPVEDATLFQKDRQLFHGIEARSESIVAQLSQLDYESKHFFHTSQRPKGSGRWILSDPEYIKWLKSTRTIGSRNWLWLSGKPGSGKTTLT
jgi:DNA replication protein DnaC